MKSKSQYKFLFILCLAWGFLVWHGQAKASSAYNCFENAGNFSGCAGTPGPNGTYVDSFGGSHSGLTGLVTYWADQIPIDALQQAFAARIRYHAAGSDYMIDNTDPFVDPGNPNNYIDQTGQWSLCLEGGAAVCMFDAVSNSYNSGPVDLNVDSGWRNISKADYGDYDYANFDMTYWCYYTRGQYTDDCSVGNPNPQTYLTQPYSGGIDNYIIEIQSRLVSIDDFSYIGPSTLGIGENFQLHWATDWATQPNYPRIMIDPDPSKISTGSISCSPFGVLDSSPPDQYPMTALEEGTINCTATGAGVVYLLLLADGPGGSGIGVEEAKEVVTVIISACGSAPGGFGIDGACTGGSSPSINVQLTSNSSGASTYDLERNINSGGWVTILNNVSATGNLSDIDYNEAVTGGVNYDWRVKAENSSGITNSNVVSIYTSLGNCGGGSVSCSLDAAFVTQTINGVTYNTSTSINLSASTTYPVSITMKNLCDDVWSEANFYRLGSQNLPNNTTWGTNRVYLPGAVTVARDQNATFNFNITTPASGTNNFQWQMVKDLSAGWFGQLTPNITININSCTYSLNPTSAAFSSSAYTGQIVDVTPNPAGCAWTAVSNDSFITITSVTPTQVTYDVSANTTGAVRNGSMTIAGINFPISQAAGSSSGVLSFGIIYSLKTLNIPTGVTLDNSTCARITVNWNYTDNGAGDGFYVYRSTDGVTWGVPITALLPISARSYTDTPPATGTTYYYRVSTHRTLGIAPQEVFSSPPHPSKVNKACTGDLSQSVKFMVTNPTTIVPGATVSYQITVINSGPSNVTIDFICDFPSPNLQSLRNLKVDKGPGPVVAPVPTLDPACSDPIYGAGYRFNISGVKNIVNNWLVTFDATFNPTTTDDHEPVSNRAVIHYTDGAGANTVTVIAPTYLIGTTKVHVPTFREVAP